MGSWGPVRGGLGQNMCEREGGSACVRVAVLAGVCRGWGMCVCVCVCALTCVHPTLTKRYISALTKLVTVMTRGRRTVMT